MNYNRIAKYTGLMFLTSMIVVSISCDNSTVEPDSSDNTNENTRDWEAYHDSIFNADLPEADWGKVRITNGIDSSMRGEATLSFRTYPTSGSAAPKTHTIHLIRIYEFDGSQQLSISIYIPDTIPIADNPNPPFPENGTYNITLGRFDNDEIGVSASYDNGSARANIWGTNSNIDENGLSVTVSNQNGSNYDISFIGIGFYNMSNSDFRVDVEGMAQKVGSNMTN